MYIQEQRSLYMNFNVIKENGITITHIVSDNLVLTDVESALDLMANVRYATKSNIIILDASLVDPTFFDLKSNLAGEILQKFVNYSMKLAIIGDFSQHTSKSLRDFIYESNKGNHILFLSDVGTAVARFSR